MPVLTPGRSQLDAAALVGLQIPPVALAVQPDACILYALAIGLVQQPDDPWSLPYVYERGLKAFPTMATVLGRPADWMAWPELAPLGGVMLHAAQRLEMHAPLPVGGGGTASNRIVEVVDKGEGRGALLIVERTLTDLGGARIATLTWTVHCRGAGGFGGRREQATPPTPAPPARTPDTVLSLRTRTDAALLYRLTGDRNPIHADPAAARAVGLERPLLHGLQLYGFVVAEVLRHAGIDPDAVAAVDMRFSGLLHPGELIELDIWQVAKGYALRVRRPERDGVVVDRGLIELK